MTLVRLRNDSAHASIAVRGAELRTWNVGDVPLLWEPDPAIWPDTAPLLFPVVGWTRGGRITIDGRSYPLGLHGFAREALFQVAEQDTSRVRLTLISNAATRALYPFEWMLDVTYALVGAGLEVEVAIRNAGDGAMPYACGLHPGFRWPFFGGVPEDYMLVFGGIEEREVPVISLEGLFTRERRAIPLQGRLLPLDRELLAAEALCFLDARSRELQFRHQSGAAIAIALDDFPHLALWSRSGGSFLSIEAWTGHGDFTDADGDLFRKPSMRHLAPGAIGRHRAKFSFEPPQPLFPPAGLAA